MYLTVNKTARFYLWKKSYVSSIFSILCSALNPSSNILYEYAAHCLKHSVVYLLCSVHHGCRTAGLPLRPKLLTGQVLLRGLRHLQCWRVPNRLGLHAGYRWSYAHRLLALFCQICTEGAAVPHPSAHAVIVHWNKVLFFFPLLTILSNLGLMLWRNTCIPFFKGGAVWEAPLSDNWSWHSTTNTVFLHHYVTNSNSVKLNGMFYVTIKLCGYNQIYC